MSDTPPPGPLESLKSKTQTRVEAIDRLHAAVGALRGVVEATSPVIKTDVEVAGGLASELRALADSIHKEPSGQPGRFGMAAAMWEAMRRADVDMETPSAFERI